MPDISKIKLPGDNNTYDISDLVARGLLLEISQDDYDALVQAGTVDPNVYYYIYDAAGTELPIDTSLDTTSSNAIANGPVASFAQSISQTVSDKMNIANPTGTGSFALNKLSGSTLGANSISIGQNNTASGDQSFAEGRETVASGNQSHAEGYQTTASMTRAHSEGSNTVASGTASHAEGSNTIANHLCQHVFGEYNLADTSTAQPTSRGNYVEIVGKGTGDSARSNARTLDWSGNEVLAGGLKINGSQDVMPSVSQTSGQFNGFVKDGEMWLFIGQIADGDASCMFLTHRVGTAMRRNMMFADSGFTFATNTQGTVSIMYNSSASNINVTVIRLK